MNVKKIIPRFKIFAKNQEIIKFKQFSGLNDYDCRFSAIESSGLVKDSYHQNGFFFPQWKNEKKKNDSPTPLFALGSCPASMIEILFLH